MTLWSSALLSGSPLHHASLPRQALRSQPLLRARVSETEAPAESQTYTKQSAAGRAEHGIRSLHAQEQATLPAPVAADARLGSRNEALVEQTRRGDAPSAMQSGVDTFAGLLLAGLNVAERLRRGFEPHPAGFPAGTHTLSVAALSLLILVRLYCSVRVHCSYERRQQELLC